MSALSGALSFRALQGEGMCTRSPSSAEEVSSDTREDGDNGALSLRGTGDCSEGNAASFSDVSRDPTGDKLEPYWSRESSIPGADFGSGETDRGELGIGTLPVPDLFVLEAHFFPLFFPPEAEASLGAGLLDCCPLSFWLAAVPAFVDLAGSD